MRELIKTFLKKVADTIKLKKNEEPEVYDPQMFACLNNLKNLPIDIKNIIDVGAAKGSWSTLAKRVFPDASFLLLEPLEERREELELLVRQNPNFNYLPLAAGQSKGTMEFQITDDLDGSGIACRMSNIEKKRTVNLTSIDLEIREQNLQGPYLVKLDTHGYEVPILEGCKNNLKDIAAFIIECYGFQIAENSLLFGEMCEYMQKNGFRLFGVIDPYNRPKDNAFWQCDACFISDQNEIFRSNTYN